MRARWGFRFWILVLLGVATLPSTRTFADTGDQPKPPANVIFDTDIGGDIDDALALAMLHALQDRNEVNIIAITISSANKWAAPYADLINHYYGHSGIPIGIVKDAPDAPEWIKEIRANSLKKHFLNSLPVGYAEALSRRQRPDGSYVFNHKIVDALEAQDSVLLLRKALSQQVDGNVVVISVGYSTNLARLLDTPPDTISTQNGRDLVQRKVRLLSVMAGNFSVQQSSLTARDLDKGLPEYNIAMDLPSAQKLFAEWPTPIVASGFEVGREKNFGLSYEFRCARDNPIVDSLAIFQSIFPQAAQNSLAYTPHDTSAALYAVRPDAGYFSLSALGRISVSEDGMTHFKKDNKGLHRYLILPEANKRRLSEVFNLLISQPAIR